MVGVGLLLQVCRPPDGSFRGDGFAVTSPWVAWDGLVIVGDHATYGHVDPSKGPFYPRTPVSVAHHSDTGR
jgi:hypothetical protein